MFVKYRLWNVPVEGAYVGSRHTEISATIAVCVLRRLMTAA